MNTGPRVLGNRYEVGDLLGRGGMAEVHLGRDTRLGRTVAIKLLRTDLARDPIFQARFRREAQSAAALNHPLIVAVYDTGEETTTESGGGVVDLPYIVMEYIEGRTLRDVLGDGRTLDVDLALEVTTGVLAALEYSHRIGIVHRDIKPANVMLTPTGDIKVMDFGIARAMADATSTMTQTQAVIGTAQYLSPEQAKGEQVDARSDLYSAGCLLFELLTGRPPFVADSPVAVAYQHVREEPPKPSSLVPGIPEPVDRIVLHALAKDREARYQTAADFRSDVEAARGGRAVSAPMAAAAAAGAAAGAATTQFIPPAAGATQSMSPAAATAAGYPATGQTGGLATSPFDDRYYGQEEPEGRGKGPWILGGVIVAVLALIGFAVAQLLGTGGTEEIAVPDVVGQPQAAATQAVEAAQLKPQIEEVESEADQKGNVVAQDPGPGGTVAVGSQVVLRIGLGPGDVEVPDVSGKPRNQALADLQDLGFRVGDIKEENSSKVDANDVIRTEPKAGEKVAKGSNVVLVIASGQVSVPNVVGDTRDAARDKLSDLGFKVRVTDQETDERAEGTVIRQSPSGGSAQSGSTVTIVVARAPAPTPEPTETDEPEPTDDEPTPTDT